MAAYGGFDIDGLATISLSMCNVRMNYFQRKYVKEQKAHRDEISRMSVSALEKVREETASFRQVSFSLQWIIHHFVYYTAAYVHTVVTT